MKRVKDNKFLIVLISVLTIFIIIICGLLINIKMKETFKKPEFDKNVLEEIPKDINYKKKIININEGYSIYISPSPKVINDNYLKVDFISLDTNKVWIKVRLLNEEEKVIGESGLVKPGEYLEKIKLYSNVKVDDKITYKIMGYEKDSYLSAGAISLNTRGGE